ncbi:LPXTG cell wall anchor domain-containing protein, partial [Listeria monocytogenes]|nr:LPXTG cell wall anchor domain-containing protein [Listeria monocytogenes]
NLYIPLNSVGTVAKTGDKNYPTKVDTTGNKLHLEFANLENSRVFIKYSTKPNENWYFYSYVQNTAKVSDNGVGEKSYSYQAYASKLFNAMTKTATIDPSFDNKVNWVVTLNNISADRPINNPTITDTMKTGTTGAQVVKSSFKVINETTGEDIDSKYYDITYTDNNFTIQFKDYKATAPIKVTYSTISLMSGLVSNTATTASPDYGSLPMTYKSRTTSISPAFTIGSGSGTATIGSLEITKVDKKDNSKKLTGAKFQLYTLEGDKAGQEATTDSDGKIVMDGLQSGKYKLVETEAPTGYTISDEYKDGKEITVTADAVTNVTIENTEQTGSAVLLKEDSVTKDAIAGAEFELQNADGTKVAENLVSNADGKIEVTDLAPGDYQFVETKAPTGYVLDGTPTKFTVEFNQEAAVVVTKENTAKTGSVVLTKEDSVSKATLSGAEFELQNAAGTKVQANLTTNADGKLEVSDLAPGDYKFVETKAPTGYELDATPVTFTIEFNQATAVNVTKDNVAKTGSVVLTKLDSKSRSNLAGAEFELQTKLGVSLKDKVVTEANGQLQIDDLAPGDYQLVETKAPTGYELDATPVDFTIAFNQQAPIQVTKTNTMSTGSVVLTKTDAETKTPLANATFKLVDEDNNITENLTTDASGKLEITDLVPGDYQLIETKAPAGYELDTVPVDVKIAFDQKETLQVTKTNLKTVVSGKVIAEFVDTKGNVLAEKEIHAGIVGDKYALKAKAIKGYTLTKEPTNKAGTFREEDQKVTFVYEKNKAPIVVNPDKPVTPVKPTKPTKTVDPAKKPTVTSLPSTGDDSPYGIIFTGLFASLVGLFLLRKSRKVND